MNFFKIKKQSSINQILLGDQSALIGIYEEIVDDIKQFIHEFGTDEGNLDNAILEALVRAWELVHYKKIETHQDLVEFSKEMSKYFWCQKENNSIAQNEVDDQIINEMLQIDDELNDFAYNNSYQSISEVFQNLSKISQKILTHVYWEHMNFEQLAVVIKSTSAKFSKEKKESSVQALMKKVE